MDNRNITGLTFEELKLVLAAWKQESFRAQQIFSWIYKRGMTNFDVMADLPVDLRVRLKENYSLFALKLVKVLQSQDAAEKFIFETNDGNFIEGVSITASERITGCISTQVGCKFSCRFCASGLLGFRRNLTASEMIEEILFLKNYSADKRLTHVVFMGIGEPLDNYDNVLKVIRIINSPLGLNIGARRITISTCGIIPGIKRLADEGLQIELSISLHAADDRTRSQIMPINKKYPLKDLIKACAEYIKKTNRQITFEYVLIKNINLDLQSAQNLATILKSLGLCKVNLIPCNPIRELNVETPAKLEILLFRDYLLKQGLNVTLRKPRGQDIAAACGQLRLRYEKN
jgi:23S rRNA (adenine2503-C2)-methyltransferase